MKKIVFVTIRMSKDYKKYKLPVEGNTLIEYPESLYFGINGVIAKTSTSEDEIFVYPIVTHGNDDAGLENAKLLENEILSINENNAKIHVEPIECDFDESKGKFKDLYKKLIKTLSEGAELYADITAGTKSLPMLVISAMQFGEKFFNCSIGYITYQKARFENGRKVEGTDCLCDVTPLYLLSSFTNTISSSSGEKAVAAVEALFED